MRLTEVATGSPGNEMVSRPRRVTGQYGEAARTGALLMLSQGWNSLPLL